MAQKKVILQKEKTHSSLNQSQKISEWIEKILQELQEKTKAISSDLLLKTLTNKTSISTSKKEPEHSPEIASKTSQGKRSKVYEENLNKITQMRGRPLFYPYIGSGLGRGPYVKLQDGSIKLDLVNGIGTHILGHSHPDVLRSSIQASLSDITMQGHLQMNEESLLLSEKILKIAKRKSRFEHVWLTTSGAMANENALKICRQKKEGARKIIAMKSAFAGRTTMMTEISDNKTLREGLPRYNEVLRVPFYDKKNPSKSIQKSLSIFKSHLEKHENDICTFIFEPILGEGGFYVAPRDFFLPLFQLCKQKSIPIWADEIQTFCRTGQFFAFETLDIGESIDICTISKALQNGATLFTDEFNPKPGLLGGTFSGSSASLAAGHTILEILDKGNFMGDQGSIAKIHKEFKNSFENLKKGSCKDCIQDIEGLGLMIAFTPLDGSKNAVTALLKRLFKNGLMGFPCGRDPYRIRFLLPAILEKKDILLAEKIIEKSLLEEKSKRYKKI